MAKSLRRPKGTRDLLPEDLTEWQRAEETFRSFAARYGYGEIRTPIFEDLALFRRSIGEETDIVGKELYVLETGGGELALRPEQTASVVRAYIENGLHKSARFSKFFYIGPQFRHERQQKNRYRQFYQLGVEALGSRGPLLDAEVIELAVKFLEALGLEGLTVKVNTLGDPACLERYRVALRAALAPHRDKLGPDDQRRLDKNVLRVLDSKDPFIKSLAPHLPKVSEFLADEDEEHFRQVCKVLDARKVAFEIDQTLVRGLDYYTGPVFEFFYKSFGQQDAVGAGGRYDGLVEQLGGPSTPCVGFALGLDRIVNAITREDSENQRSGRATGLQVFVVQDHTAEPRDVAQLVGALRAAEFLCDTDYEQKSESAQLKVAKRRKAQVAVKLRTNVEHPDGLSCSVVLTDLTSWIDTSLYHQKAHDPARVVKAVRERLHGNTQ